MKRQGEAYRDQVRQFVVQNFYVGDLQLTDDTSLLGSGIVDSTGVLEVIAFLESEFGVVVADDETTAENLDSINAIAAFVDRKQTFGPGEAKVALPAS